MLNNRELASAILIGVALFAACLSKDIRSSFRQVLRSAIAPKLAVIWLAFSLVLAGSTYVLQRTGLDYDGSTKDAVVWGLVVGLPLLFKFDALGGQPGLGRDMLLQALKLTALVEFFVNLYVFPLWVELFLQPFLALVVVTSAVAGREEATRPAKKFLDGVAAIAGLTIALVVAKHLLQQRDIDGRATLLSFTQPLILSVAILSLTYLVALAAAYEMAFMRIGWRERSRRHRVRAKLALVVTLHLRLHKIHDFSGTLPRRLVDASSWQSAREFLRIYRSGQEPPFPTEPSVESQQTGFGGTRAEWDQHRQPRRGYTSGAVYGPDVRPGQPRYTAVNWSEGGRTISYTLNFPATTPLAQAQRQVIREFPKAASVSRRRWQESCYQEGFATIVPNGGLQDGYEPVVAYFTEGHAPLDDEDIRWASLSVYTIGEFARC